MPETNPRLIDLHPPRSDMRADVLEGLVRSPKVISPKYFYDTRGSELFRQITELPEYYPTRTENAIMDSNLHEMAELIGPGAAVIEFGSGTGEKIRRLLRHLDRPQACIPVEISRDHLEQTANGLARDFPELDVVAVCADFTRPFDFPDNGSRRNLVFFPGSTIGNFGPPEALDLLRVMRETAGDDGGLLIGIDRIKDTATLERAYNDAAGVTAEFNLNLLTRFNRELGADFNRGSFRHEAVYNEAAARIEMYLVCEHAVTARIGDADIHFKPGERILTEYSYKFEVGAFEATAQAAGFRPVRTWSDPRRFFSVLYFEC
jgi:dimethylhistidine N-methyltransferase